MYLAFDLGSMVLRDLVDRSARLIAIVAEGQQTPDLIEREAEIAGPADKAQAVQMSLIVGAIITFGPAGLGQQTVLLVKSDRLDLGPCLLREKADCQKVRRHVLTL